MKPDELDIPLSHKAVLHRYLQQLSLSLVGVFLLSATVDYFSPESRPLKLFWIADGILIGLSMVIHLILKEPSGNEHWFLVVTRRVDWVEKIHWPVIGLTIAVMGNILFSEWVRMRGENGSGPVFLCLAIVGASLVHVNYRHYLLVVLVAITGWWAIKWNRIPPAEIRQDAIVQVVSTVFALVVMTVRMRLHRQLIALLQQNRRDRHQLKDALQRVEISITRRHQMAAEQRALKTQLEQAQKMEAVGRLAGGVAHDINNMLAAITGVAQPWTVDDTLPAEYREDMEIIHAACRRGKILTGNLLTVARQGRFNPGCIDLNQLITDVKTYIGRSIPEGIRFETNLTATNAIVWGDRRQINQVIVNLINNGVDAMGPNGHLVVKTAVVSEVERNGVEALEHATGQFVKAVVSDTGEGMDEQTIQCAFEPFFSTRTVGDASGLGLSTVYGTISNHGGAVLICSAVGQGTSVTIYLPVCDDAIAPSGTQSVDSTPRDNRSVTVLLVDDEPLVRQGAHRMLTAMGHTVVTARNGKEAVAAYAQSKNVIDVVLLDLIMPELDGEQTFEQLREWDADVRVIFVSAYCRDTDRVQRLLDAGALEFIEKPYSMEDLSRALAGVT